MDIFYGKVVSFWGLCPRPSPGLCPWTPLGDFAAKPPDFCSPGNNSWLRHWLTPQQTSFSWDRHTLSLPRHTFDILTFDLSYLHLLASSSSVCTLTEVSVRILVFHSLQKFACSSCRFWIWLWSYYGRLDMLLSSTCISRCNWHIVCFADNCCSSNIFRRNYTAESHC